MIKENSDCKVIDTLARTIWGEARGEPISGQEAVANVILNRVKSPVTWWGKDIIGVCTKEWQFSCWNKNDPNYKKLVKVGDEDVAFCICRRIATRAVHGVLEDNTNNATHYHTKDIFPKWAKDKIPCAEVGHHLFYNDIE